MRNAAGLRPGTLRAPMRNWMLTAVLVLALAGGLIAAWPVQAQEGGQAGPLVIFVEGGRPHDAGYAGFRRHKETTTCSSGCSTASAAWC